MKYFFKASGMFDIYADSNKPEYYTVLVKKKGRGHTWSYCGNGNGEIFKFDTLQEARQKAQKLKQKGVSDE